jgi:hypothetical protein
LVDWRAAGQSDEPIDDEGEMLVAKNVPEIAVSTPKGLETIEPKSESAAPASLQAVKMNWKDLRDHSSPVGLLESAARKLGSGLAIFGESCLKIPGLDFADRTTIGTAKHLILWQYPPSMKVFRDLFTQGSVREVYIIGGVPVDQEDAKAFIKRLLGFARFAVNQKEGKVPGEKLAVALGTTKMCVALGLTILNKIGVLEWFAEDGVIYLDIIGEPTEKAENIAEFRQLANSLKEVNDFRNWLKDSEFKEIQAALALNKVVLHKGKEISGRDDDFGGDNEREEQGRESKLAQEQNS